MITNGNLDLHKRMKNTTNTKYVGKNTPPIFKFL